MDYVERLLASNERVVRIAHGHWITLLPTILADVAVAIVIMGLSVAGIVLSPPWTWFGLVLLFVPMAHLAIRLWGWWSRQYVVTSRRVIQVSGTLSKRTSDTSLDKVNDIIMTQSALGRLLKFGDIEIIAGSESGVDVFRRIADPIEFKKELLNQKDSLERPRPAADRGEREADAVESSPGEIPELIAQLDELRRKGLLTDAEFEEKRRRLLEKL